MQQVKELAVAFLIASNVFAAEPDAAPVSDAKAAAGSPRDRDVVVLERFVVEASRIDEHPWRYASVPGFEILSRCDDTKTEWYIQGLMLGIREGKAMLPEGCLVPLTATPIQGGELR